MGSPRSTQTSGLAQPLPVSREQNRLADADVSGAVPAVAAVFRNAVCVLRTGSARNRTTRLGAREHPIIFTVVATLILLAGTRRERFALHDRSSIGAARSTAVPAPSTARAGGLGPADQQPTLTERQPARVSRSLHILRLLHGRWPECFASQRTTYTERSLIYPSCTPSLDDSSERSCPRPTDSLGQSDDPLQRERGRLDDLQSFFAGVEGCTASLPFYLGRGFLRSRRAWLSAQGRTLNLVPVLKRPETPSHDWPTEASSAFAGRTAKRTSPAVAAKTSGTLKSTS